MLYINTESKETMEQSLYEFLNIRENDLRRLYENLDNISEENEIENSYHDFIDCYTLYKSIKGVPFYHFTRRLDNNSEEIQGNNLHELLIKESAISQFLKNHGIQFKLSGSKLDLYYKGEYISLNDDTKKNYRHLEYRLNHDVAFNGFLIRDLLYNHDYKNDLSMAPEIIVDLGLFLDKNDLKYDFHSKSTYYCFEYLVPLEKVIFDGKDELSFEGKQRLILKLILERLYKHSIKDLSILGDYSSVIRLDDESFMESKYFVNKKEIK